MDHNELTVGHYLIRQAPSVARAKADKEGDGWTLTGVACATDAEYAFGNPKTWGWMESVKPGAFKTTLEADPDVILNVNHSRDLVLARTTSTVAPLRLWEDKEGLQVEGRMSPDDPDAARARAKIEAGTMSQMSFAFRIRGYEFIEGEDEDDEPDRLQITEVDLEHGDVSLVTFPASPHTSAGLRGQEQQWEPPEALRRALQIRHSNSELRRELAEARAELAEVRLTLLSAALQ